MTLDEKLQADCDLVDRVERAISKLMFALKDMGYEWKLGKASHKSEYGVVYDLWSNGHRKEGEASPRRTDLDNLIYEAIDMFQVARARDGVKAIIWRISPEITSHEGRWKLYFRWHFLNEMADAA